MGSGRQPTRAAPLPRNRTASASPRKTASECSPNPGAVTGSASGVTAIRNGNQTFGAVPATGCGTGLTISLSRIVLVWRAAATPTPRAIPEAVREVPLSWHRPALAYSVEKFLLPDRDRGLFPDGYSVNDSPRDRHARDTQGDQHGPILPIGWPHA